jgi:hypothetical protein
MREACFKQMREACFNGVVNQAVSTEWRKRFELICCFKEGTQSVLGIVACNTSDPIVTAHRPNWYVKSRTQGTAALAPTFDLSAPCVYGGCCPKVSFEAAMVVFFKIPY